MDNVINTDTPKIPNILTEIFTSHPLQLLFAIQKLGRETSPKLPIVLEGVSLSVKESIERSPLDEVETLCEGVKSWQDIQDLYVGGFIANKYIEPIYRCFSHQGKIHHRNLLLDDREMFGYTEHDMNILINLGIFKGSQEEHRQEIENFFNQDINHLLVAFLRSQGVKDIDVWRSRFGIGFEGESVLYGRNSCIRVYQNTHEYQGDFRSIPKLLKLPQEVRLPTIEDFRGILGYLTSCGFSEDTQVCSFFMEVLGFEEGKKYMIDERGRLCFLEFSKTQGINLILYEGLSGDTFLPEEGITCIREMREEEYEDT